jgi:hypothetical protein
MRRIQNPVDRQTALYGINPTPTKVEQVDTAMTDKIKKGLKFAKLGSNPTEIYNMIKDADPSPDKNYTKWLIKTFGQDPKTFLDDLNRGKEYLGLLFGEQVKDTMARWAQVSMNKFRSISELGQYLIEKKVLIIGLQSDSEFVDNAKTAVMNGDAAILYFDDDVIYCDAITETGDCLLGKGTQWCTISGAFQNYKAGGLIIMYIRESGKRVQFTAQTDDPMSNGVFREAKDESDAEINWKNYPAKFLKLAKQVSKIVLDRIKATNFLTPITQYLNNSNDPIYDIIKERYANAKLLPIEFIEENADRIAKLFNNTDLTGKAFKIERDYLLTGIAYDILMVELLVRRHKGIKREEVYLDMKDIPGGKHKFQDIDVILDAFEMNAYETTNGLWLYVVGEDAKGSWDDYCPIGLPKVNVSWYDCINFCNQLSELYGLQPVYEIKGDEVNWIWEANGFRLPSEAEWEAAARARSNFTYAGSDDPDEVAWYSANSDNRRHLVGLKKPNGYKLYDMSGNVSEWVYDSYSSDPSDKEEQPLRDPSLANKSNPRRRKNRR